MFENATSRPLISICIPAYKRPGNVARLLDSIRAQSFRDFEIVLTDDSPDDSVKQVLSRYEDLPIRYLHNDIALGTPANWNFGIGQARGEWIKLMHDDDWFAIPQSLQQFAEATRSGSKFIVSRYQNVFEDQHTERPAFPQKWRAQIIKKPLLLLSNNVIGPPSVTLVHNSIKDRYDPAMKWRVDMDYYIRLLQIHRDFRLVDEVLINVGISSTQVTNDCINLPQVELPEGYLMLKKFGTRPLRDIRVYDAWWRILRNVGVRTEGDLTAFGQREWPKAIFGIVNSQRRIPADWLKIGIVSKIAMTLSYLINLRHLD